VYSLDTGTESQGAYLEMTPILVDEFSIKPLYLETYLSSSRVGIATGFAVKRGDSYYLCTNWHVVTCKHPNDNRPLSSSGIADPDTLRVWFHSPNLWAHGKPRIFVLLMPRDTNYGRNITSAERLM